MADVERHFGKQGNDKTVPDPTFVFSCIDPWEQQSIDVSVWVIGKWDFEYVGHATQGSNIVHQPISKTWCIDDNWYACLAKGATVISIDGQDNSANQFISNLKRKYLEYLVELELLSDHAKS